MAQQVPLTSDARADPGEQADGTHEIAPDLAYCRLLIANVIFYGRRDDGWVLIDTGVHGTKGVIQRAAAARFGTGWRPSAIILTHGHFDHVGTLEDLATEWDVPVYAHTLEHPYLTGKAAYPEGDPGVGGGLMAALSKLYPTKPVNVSDRLRPLPPDGSIPGMPGWQWLPTPGHSPGHVSFWRSADRALIAGDAFVTTAPESVYATTVQSPEMHGPPRYFTIDWDSARRSVEMLAKLGPDLVITGHGRAMQGPEMTEALKLLAREFDAIAVPQQGRYVAHPATVENGLAYQPPA